jgi:hypothetical protein
MDINPALERLKQNDLEFEVSLGYIVNSCLNKTKTKKNYRRK